MQRSVPAVAGLARSCADARVCIRGGLTICCRCAFLLDASHKAWSKEEDREALVLLLGSSAPTLAYLIAYCP